MMPLGRIAVVSLHTCPWQQPGIANAGGMNVYVSQTALRLAERGWSVDVFTRSHKGVHEPVVEKAPGLRLIHAPAGPRGVPKDDLHRFIEPFVAAVRAFALRDGRRYDALVSHYWLSGLASIELATSWGVRHLAGFHTLSLVKQHAFPDESAPAARVAGERRVIDSADHLLAISPHERRALGEAYGADFSRISVASPGIDRSRFHSRSQTLCREELGLANDGHVVLSVGRPTPLKGVDILLKALAQISDPTLSAILVGGDLGSEDQRGLQDLAARIGVASRVHFTGSLPHTQLPTYYGACDVCVVPSFYESFGLVALEAIACERPVIASRVGGLRALVREDVDGRLVKPGSVSDLASALTEMLDAGTPQTPSSGGSSLQTWSATTDAMLSALQKAA